MAVMSICVVSNDMMTRRTRIAFLLLFFEIAISAACECAGNIMQTMGAGTRVAHIAVKAVELSVVPFISVAACSIFERTRLVRVLLVMACANALLEMTSAVTGVVYFVDEANIYHHGALYGVYVAVYLVSFAAVIFEALRYTSRYQYRSLGFIVAIFLFMLAGFAATVAIGTLQVDFIVTAFAAIMVYILNGDLMQQTDPLTNLLNRRGYENYIARQQEESVILFFDVDYFKRINDQYGHAFGDRCLKSVSSAILTCYRPYGRCFRIGGDEFCVVMTKGTERVPEINSSFYRTLEGMREGEGCLPYVSVGYVYFEPHEQ